MKTKKAWLIATFVAVVSLTYPASVLIKLGSHLEDAQRWIKNDPAFNVFMPFIFFLVIGIFLTSVDLRPVGQLSRGKKSASYFILTVLLILAAFAVSSTVDRPLLEPFLFCDADSALAMETSIREALRREYRALVEIQNDEKRSLAKEALSRHRDLALAGYSEEFPPFGTFDEMFRRGSYCAWLALAVNSVAGIVVAIIFWYFWNLVLFRSAFSTGNPEWIVLVTGLLVLWFPSRLYTEWYIGMYSLKTMKEYHAFTFLGIVAIAGYGFCIFKLAKSLSVKIFSAVGTGLFGLLGILGMIKPSWLGFVALGIEDMPFSWFFASLAIILITLAAMMLSFVGDSGAQGARQRQSVKKRRPTKTSDG